MTVCDQKAISVVHDSPTRHAHTVSLSLSLSLSLPPPQKKNKTTTTTTTNKTTTTHTQQTTTKKKERVSPCRETKYNFHSRKGWWFIEFHCMPIAYKSSVMMMMWGLKSSNVGLIIECDRYTDIQKPRPIETGWRRWHWQLYTLF